jgi:hypothetical protein
MNARACVIASAAGEGLFMKARKPILIAVLMTSSSMSTAVVAAERWQQATFPPPNAGLLVFSIGTDGNPACASYDGANYL